GRPRASAREDDGRGCARVGGGVRAGARSPGDMGLPPDGHVTPPHVSVVLPTRNGADTLPAVLAAIRRQRADLAVEIVAVDSSSTDGTAELLRRSADRVVSIAADAFDHGLTRNLGIEHARGELVVLMVQDAEPASDRWLAALTAPLLTD